MAGRLTGKKAFITAAGQGIGRATALLFAREGAQVIATDIALEKMKDLQGQASIKTAKLDVLDPAAIAAMAKETGGVNVLFNCAGFVHHGSVLEATEEQWAFAFDLNVRSMFRMIKAFIPGMLAAGGGSIINMSSVVGAPRGVVNRFVYGATKAAVVGVTKSVAADFIAKGIRCNCICPGTVQTPSLDDRINAFADPVQARKDFIARQPMGRLGNAEEIAALALYLASDDTQYMTGQAINIDGGMSV